jgi:hypothetical protein
MLHPALLLLKTVEQRSHTGGFITKVWQPGKKSWNLIQTAFATVGTAPFNGANFYSFYYWNGRNLMQLVTYVAYCFAPVAGYSSFGSYTGNGSADGPFVYTGFRPRFCDD